jgi:hypothetical protein
VLKIQEGKNYRQKKFKKFLVVKCYVLFGELEASLHLKVLHLPVGSVGNEQKNEQMYCNFGAKTAKTLTKFCKGTCIVL